MNSLRKTISLISLNIKTFGAQYKFEKASDQLKKFNAHYPNDSFLRLAEIITKPVTNIKNVMLPDAILNQALAINDFHGLARQRSLIETQRQAQKIKLKKIAKAKRDLKSGKAQKNNHVNTKSKEIYFKRKLLNTYHQYGIEATPSSPTRNQSSNIPQPTLRVA